MKGWTSERAAMLRQLWAAGLSCSVIADRINARFPGAALTKNAVVGKVQRLGLKPRETSLGRDGVIQDRSKVKPSIKPKVEPKAEEAAPKPIPQAHWPREQEDALRELHAAGVSYDDIAAQLSVRFPDRTFTKVVICGKCKRLGLTRRDKTSNRSESNRHAIDIASLEEVRAACKPSATSRFFLPPSRPRLRGVLRMPAECPPAPECISIPLLDLTSKTCHWPLDERNEDGDRLFCGGEVGALDPRRRYCDHHRWREAG
jgi:hypothetical protein